MLDIQDLDEMYEVTRKNKEAISSEDLKSELWLEILKIHKKIYKDSELSIKINKSRAEALSEDSIQKNFESYFKYITIATYPKQIILKDVIRYLNKYHKA